MTFVDGPYGVWLGLTALPENPDQLRELAAGIESLGYSAIWLGGSWGANLTVPATLLSATSTVVVGTSISNIWRDPADEVAAGYTRVAGEYGDRFVLGVGAGHHVQTQWNQNEYRRPLEKLAAFLDGLDRAEPPVPASRRALAALGPKALTLAAERSAGTLPYLVTAEHAAQARRQLGPGPFIGPMQMTVQSDDVTQSRIVARKALNRYLELPNYTNAWRRLGFTDDDIAGGGSDRLVDALVAHGDPAALKVRLDEHLSAGADHVCVQPLPLPGRVELDDLRDLAAVLF